MNHNQKYKEYVSENMNDHDDSTHEPMEMHIAMPTCIPYITPVYKPSITLTYMPSSVNKSVIIVPKNIETLREPINNLVYITIGFASFLFIVMGFYMSMMHKKQQLFKMKKLNRNNLQVAIPNNIYEKIQERGTSISIRVLSGETTDVFCRMHENAIRDYNKHF